MSEVVPDLPDELKIATLVIRDDAKRAHPVVEPIEKFFQALRHRASVDFAE